MKRQPNDAAENLTKWLKKLFLTFRQNVTPEALETYHQTLGFFNVSEQELAFPEAIRRATDGYMPTPGQIIAALESLRDRFGVRPPSEHDDCPHCGGTGFKIIAARDPVTNLELGNGYKWAVRCKWQRPSGQTRERKPEYSAKDCPEGRAFLAKLKEVSEAVSMKKATA